MKKVLLIFIMLIISGCGPKQESSWENKISFGEDEFEQEIRPETTQNTETFSTIPILAYRHIAPNSNVSLSDSSTISLENFEKQMEWLKENDYDTLATNDLAEREILAKSVILTFDDGYWDFYTKALPVLSSFDFSAGIAIVTDKIGQPGYLTSGQINELAAQGMEIMSHSLTHPDLTEISRQEQIKEIFESKKYLEENFDVVVNAFVYPRGEYNDKTVGMMREAGYGAALTDDLGLTDLKTSHFRMKRVEVNPKDTLEDFIKKVTEKN